MQWPGFGSTDWRTEPGLVAIAIPDQYVLQFLLTHHHATCRIALVFNYIQSGIEAAWYRADRRAATRSGRMRKETTSALLRSSFSAGRDRGGGAGIRWSSSDLGGHREDSLLRIYRALPGFADHPHVTTGLDSDGLKPPIPIKQEPWTGRWTDPGLFCSPSASRYNFSACLVTRATDAGFAGAQARRQTSVSINPKAKTKNPKVTLFRMPIESAIGFPRP